MEHCMREKLSQQNRGRFQFVLGRSQIQFVNTSRGDRGAIRDNLCTAIAR